MLYWTIKITIISIILIFLVHHLISFFTSTLTVPKIKDILTSSSQKYDLIYNIISKPDTQIHDNPQNMYNKTTSIDLLPSASSDDNMKLELKNFIKNQMNQHTEMGTTNIADIDYNTRM
jgi:hypothetical protein